MAFDEERLAMLLRTLRPAPEAWVEAATELPRARRELDDLVARAEADVEFRAALIADLERALESAGYAPDRALVDALRRRLSLP
jgi:hypothetical protein